MNTVSLELAKQLYQSGVEIEEAALWWVSSQRDGWYIVPENDILKDENNEVIEKALPAPTTDELLDWLPRLNEYDLATAHPTVQKVKGIGSVTLYKAGYFDAQPTYPHWIIEFVTDTPADALAKLALWVKEQQ